MAWLDTREPTVDWSAAVGRLWTTDAAAAELDPPLLGYLDDPSRPPVSVTPFQAPRAHSVSSPTYGRAYTVESDSSREYDRPRRRRDSAPEESSGGSPWFRRIGIGGGIFAIILVIRVIAACAGAGTKVPSNSPSYSPNLPPSYAPSYTYPTFAQPAYDFTPPTRSGTGTVKIFTDEQVRACQEYDAKRSGPIPPAYPNWVKYGRPAANTVARPVSGR